LAPVPPAARFAKANGETSASPGSRASKGALLLLLTITRHARVTRLAGVNLAGLGKPGWGAHSGMCRPGRAVQPCGQDEVDHAAKAAAPAARLVLVLAAMHAARLKAIRGQESRRRETELGAQRRSRFGGWQF